MTATALAAWFAAFSVPAGAVVAFLKWYIGRLDDKEEKEIAREKKERDDEIARQDKLRDELRVDMQQRIDRLDETIRIQGSLVNVLMGHIRVLENKMSAAGLEVPVLNIENIEKLMERMR